MTSFDMVSPQFTMDPIRAIAKASGGCPVARVGARRSDAWLVARYADVRALLRDRRVVMHVETPGSTGRAIDRSILDCELLSIDRSDLPRLGSDEALCSLCSIFFVAGYENVVQAIAFAVANRMRVDGGLAGFEEMGPTDAQRAVDELLRIDTPEPFAARRDASVPISVAGIRIEAGEELLFGLSAANIDGARWPSASEIQLFRDDSRQHLTFGYGPHRCPGEALARLELEEALRALAVRFSRLVIDLPPHEQMEQLWAGGWRHRSLRRLPVRSLR